MKSKINSDENSAAPHNMTQSLTYRIGNKLIKPVLQRYWRIKRGATLGAQGVVFDRENRILLIRHTYRPGWHFPGGGVEFNETIETALMRELHEETGVIVQGVPQLHGIFANFQAFRGDHIALFIVRDWHQPTIPRSNAEIAEQGFFAPHDLPEQTTQGVKNRLNEILHAGALSSNWL